MAAITEEDKIEFFKIPRLILKEAEAIFDEMVPKTQISDINDAARRTDAIVNIARFLQEIDHY